MTHIYKPLSFYTSEQQKPLVFHCLDVGEGLMVLIIFPDQTTMLYDCNVIEDNKNYIFNYLKKHIPSLVIDGEEKQIIDIFVNSHRDQDHLRGIKDIDNDFPILSIRDSDQSGNSSPDYLDYMAIKRNLAKGGRVFLPTANVNVYQTIGGANIFCLNPDKTVDISDDQITDKEAHVKCIVLSIQYGGKTILLTGDSGYDVWRDYIIPTFEGTDIVKSDILVVSHHGSRSFFTDSKSNEDIDIEANPDNTYIEHITCIKPDFSIISCGGYEKNHLPNKQAVKIYKENTSNQQVYSTQEKGGLEGFIDQTGNWSIIPSRFETNRVHTTPHNFDFDIICKNKNSGITYETYCNISVGEVLQFSIQTKGGLADIAPKVYREVSNGGLWDHIDHDEIYYKQDTEKTTWDRFERNVAYVGRHLLRCRVFGKSTDITKVFVVNGIK